VRQIVAFLPVELVDEVDRRSRDAGVSRAEMLGRILADAVPRLLAELLIRLPQEWSVVDGEDVEALPAAYALPDRERHHAEPVP